MVGICARIACSILNKSNAFKCILVALAVTVGFVAVMSCADVMGVVFVRIQSIKNTEEIKYFPVILESFKDLMVLLHLWIGKLM